LPLDAKPMPAAGEKGCIDGGFDPPRRPGESAFQTAWLWSDDHAPGFLELAVARCVDGVLGIINQDCGVDRTRIVSHQWSLLGNSALLWERNGEKWQQGYRSRPSWTAITRHARTGLSGVGSVRENDMLHDMDRWTTEWSIAEFYMHARERDQHSREGYINLAARLIDYPVHQTNGIWDGVRNKEYGTNSMPGEDALFWLFDAYPDRPFYLDHTPPYVPPPVRDVHITGGSQLSWSATIWSDRQAAWDEWQDFSQFEYGWQSGAGAAVTQLATTVHNNAVVGAVDGPGQWVVRAVSKAGKHGEWTAASAGAIQPPRARNLPPGLDSAAATIANKNATPVERRTALRMLALHTGELPPAAMQVLNDRADDINVRIAALGALQRVKAEGLAAALAAIVANPADDVKLRRDAAGTLGRIGATDQVELLIDRLAAADEDPRVRLYAARSIGMLAPDHRKFGAGLASLIEWGFAQPSSVEAEVVNEISCAIAAAHNVEATVPALIAAIEAPANQWKTVRKSQAAEALGALARAGNRAAQTALIDLAKKPASDYPDVFVRGRIVGQAARLEKGDAQALKQLKDEAEPPVIRWEAARGLRMADRKPGRQTLPLMRKLLTDTSAAHGLRFEAARMLAAWGERGDVSALAGVLKNGDEWPELRELCARSLGDMAQRDVDSAGCVKALLAGLDSPQCDRGIRYFVGDALNRALGLGLPLGDGAPFDAAKAVWMKGRAR
ncbi:MAG: HEAT repeat domain-containing protein, partial [Planctomycetota bacterium]